MKECGEEIAVKFGTDYRRVVEQADTSVLKADDLRVMWVRIPPRLFPINVSQLFGLHAGFISTLCVEIFYISPKLLYGVPTTTPRCSGWDLILSIENKTFNGRFYPNKKPPRVRERFSITNLIFLKILVRCGDFAPNHPGDRCRWQLPEIHETKPAGKCFYI